MSASDLASERRSLNDDAWDVFLARCELRRKQIVRDSGLDFIDAASRISEQAVEIRDLRNERDRLSKALAIANAEVIESHSEILKLRTLARSAKRGSDMQKRIDYLIDANERLEMERDQARRDARAFEIAVSIERNSAA